MAVFATINKHSGKVITILSALVFVFSITYVCNTLFVHPGKYVDFSIFKNYGFYSIVGLLFLVVAIAVCNVGIEAYKWWYMVNTVEVSSYRKALKSILTGLAIGFITPNRLGDFPGRALQFKKDNAGKIVLLNLLSGYAQFTIICVLAIFSVLFLPQNFFFFFNAERFYPYAYLLGFMFLFVYHVWFLFKPQFFINLLFKIKFLNRLKRFFINFQPLSYTDNFAILHFSFLRSLLYTTQLLLIFYFFQPNIKIFDLFLYTNFYFFILTVAPSFMLNKLGIRESISLMVFSDLIDNPVVIVVSVLLLWIINQVIPALAGAVFLVSKKGSA